MLTTLTLSWRRLLVGVGTGVALVDWVDEAELDAALELELELWLAMLLLEEWVDDATEDDEDEEGGGDQVEVELWL